MGALSPGAHRSRGAALVECCMPRLLGLSCILFAGACASSTQQRLSYEGHSAVIAISPTVVDAVVTVRNTGRATANIPTLNCPLWVAGYATPERNEEPIWKSEPNQCFLPVPTVTPILVAPGDFYDFRVA